MAAACLRGGCTSTSTPHPSTRTACVCSTSSCRGAKRKRTKAARFDFLLQLLAPPRQLLIHILHAANGGHREAAASGPGPATHGSVCPQGRGRRSRAQLAAAGKTAPCSRSPTRSPHRARHNKASSAHGLQCPVYSRPPSQSPQIRRVRRWGRRPPWAPQTDPHRPTCLLPQSQPSAVAAREYCLSRGGSAAAAAAAGCSALRAPPRGACGWSVLRCAGFTWNSVCKGRGKPAAWCIGTRTRRAMARQRAAAAAATRAMVQRRCETAHGGCSTVPRDPAAGRQAALRRLRQARRRRSPRLPGARFTAFSSYGRCACIAQKLRAGPPKCPCTAGASRARGSFCRTANPHLHHRLNDYEAPEDLSAAAGAARPLPPRPASFEQLGAVQHCGGEHAVGAGITRTEELWGVGEEVRGLRGRCGRGEGGLPLHLRPGLPLGRPPTSRPGIATEGLEFPHSLPPKQPPVF